MTPTVGRILHYQLRADGACLAAIVVKVHPTGNVNLVVFDEDGDSDARHGIGQLAEGAAGAGGRWHWPERVEE